MRVRPIFTVVLVLVLGVVIVALAQDMTMTYGAKLDTVSYLTVFQVADNKIGFFNTQDKKLYIYDLSLNRCDKIFQLQQLGSPMLELRKY